MSAGASSASLRRQGQGYRSGETLPLGAASGKPAAQASRLSRGHMRLCLQDVPAFIARFANARPLLARPGIRHPHRGAVGRILGARWSESTLTRMSGRFPPERMKAARTSRPSQRARVAILEQMEKAKVSPTLFFPANAPTSRFPSWRWRWFCAAWASRTRPFTASAAFRDWAGNETQFPRELAEHALAHVIGDKAEQAYRRSDALTRRRELMDAWARHCEGGAG